MYIYIYIYIYICTLGVLLLCKPDFLKFAFALHGGTIGAKDSCFYEKFYYY